MQLDLITSTKKCNRCGEVKWRDEFYSAYDSKRPRKLDSHCKTCRNKKRYLLRKDKPRYKAHRKDSRKRKAEILRRLVYQGGCISCTETEPYCLAIHHLDPSKKEYAFSQLINKGLTGNLKRELAKGAVVLCLNCHARVHAGLLFILPFAPSPRID